MKFRTFRALLLGAGVAGAGGLIAWRFSARPAAPPLVAPAVPAAPAPPLPGNQAPAKPLLPPAQVATDGTAAGHPLRAMDQEILGRLATPLRGEKAKDALPGRPYKVNLFQEGGARLPNRVKIDLDRDDRWDEKWSVERDGGTMKIKRQVAPADDERYTDEYRLDAGRWRRK